MMKKSSTWYLTNVSHSTRRIAIVGSGVSGLAAASVLFKAGHDITIYEKSTHVGGHAQTIPVHFGANDPSSHRSVTVDVGFMVFNHCTYTNMIPWLESHDVKFEPTDMSLSVSLRHADGRELIEWGSDIAGLFARRRNLTDLSFWSMLKEMVRFNRDALAFLQEVNGDDEEGYSAEASDELLGAFLQRKGYARSFIDFYIIPVCAAVWSCPRERVLDFPVYFILSFMKNHHLLQITGRPQWYTISERTQDGYIKKVTAPFWDKIKTATEIISITTETRSNGSTVVHLTDRSGVSETFDHCILACHAPEAIRILGESITNTEKEILSAFEYCDNKIYLHRDSNLMPSRKTVWSSWNFMGSDTEGVFVTYWLNRLQNLDDSICQGEPILISLNPATPPRSDLIEAQWVTGHPVPSIRAAKAQRKINDIQGSRHLWFAGAYLRFGFHEDGVRSGFLAAHSLLKSLSKSEQCDLSLLHLKPSLPTFTIGWIESAARIIVRNFFARFIVVGKLELRELGGQVALFQGNSQIDLPISSLSLGEQSSLRQIGLTPTNPLHVIVNIVRGSFYTKLATRFDLGLADAFIDGDVEMVGKNSTDLVALFEFLILNREVHLKHHRLGSSFLPTSITNIITSIGKYLPSTFKLSTGSPITAVLGMSTSYLNHLARKNTLTNSRQNIQAHYDASNDLFALFLDETMTYSAGICHNPIETLYQCQMNKLETLIEKLRVRSTDHVLEIGFGWGSLCMALVQKTGCRVTGITLSQEQMTFTQERIRAAGLEEKIDLQLCDYRKHHCLVKTGYQYDRIVACEMLEAVGHDYLGEFFSQTSRLLKTDGLLLVQVITTPDSRYDEYRRSSDFIKEQIFPGGCAPSFSAVVNAAAVSSDLTVEHAENNCGLSYARTLELWRQRFEANARKIMSLNTAFDERFIRKWIYYFAYCESGFRTRTLGNFQILFSRAGNDNVGLTGDRSVFKNDKAI